MPRGKGRARGWGRGGFTLLELVLVMLLVATVAGIMAPSFRGYGAGAKVKNGAHEVMAVLQWARAQAASEGRVHRVEFEGSEYLVLVRGEGGEMVDVVADLGRRGALPEGVSVRVTREDGAPEQYVEVYPDGRTDVARIELVRGESRLGVWCEAPAERFRLASADEMEGWR